MSWDSGRVVALLVQAGELAKKAREDLRPSFKDDDSIVTRADREIEALFSEAFEDPKRGEHVIGEETVGDKGEAYIESALRETAYVVDPIDGTVPYASGLHHWGISVGKMVGGVLVEGAVYLPDYGELVLSTERGIEEGKLQNGAWIWRELRPPPRPVGDSGLVAVTQSLAKWGKVRLKNPVQVLGCAVVPLIGLLQGRFVAYLGSVKLWDAAGALPLVLRAGFTASVGVDGEVRRVGPRVDERIYMLAPGGGERWSFRADLLITYPEDEERMRTAMASG